MSHDGFVIALGILVSVVGWLVNRVISNFDAAVKALGERVLYLERHLNITSKDN